MDKNTPPENSSSSNQDIMSDAKTTAIQFFKEKYNLDVEITNEEMMPTIVANKVNLEGFVIDHPEQTFKISVDYKTNETSNFAMNPELKKAIKGE